MENINITPGTPIQSFGAPTPPTPQKNIYKSLFYIFFILFLIVTSVSTTLLITKNKDGALVEIPQTNENLATSPTAIPTISQEVVSSKSSDGSVICYQNRKYFIAQELNSQESYVLVKTKSNEATNYDCVYNLEESDLVIKDPANHYFGLENNFLLIDIGTGPGTRGLDIYDLDKKTKIYSGSYGSGGQNSIEISDNTVVFWKPTTIKATGENCPNLAEYEKIGFTTVVEEQTKLNLMTLKEESLKELRCSPRQ
ncbi:hypothetical protein KKD37_03140 [Patescibacteria group bacterium]|nr:hypothetical protein [Patescibacteria group bacterium]